MIDLLRAGNLFFTVPLVFIGIAVIGIAARAALVDRQRRQLSTELQTIFHLGLFAFVFGVLSQALGLYQMMDAVERVGGVSPALVAGGLKVSLIAPLMGVIVFAIALASRIALELWAAKSDRRNVPT